MRALLFFLVALAWAGCGDDDGVTPMGDGGAPDVGVDGGPTGPIEMVFSLDAEAAFFDRPFPLEARRTPAGTVSAAGFPNPRHLEMIDEYVAAIEADVDGFSPSGPIWMRFTGPLDPATFP